MYMSFKLRLVLLIFSTVWIGLVYLLVKKDKLNIRNSIIWFITGFIIMVIALFPFILETICNTFGFVTMANLVTGILITILMLLTLKLSIIVTEQKEQIRKLVQEVSLLKKDKNEK